MRGAYRRLAASVSARLADIGVGARDFWKTAFVTSDLDRCRREASQDPHLLPGKLIVSVTSHVPRFATLHRTLASLLVQTVKADAVILWVAQEHLHDLPARTLQLRELGLDIRGVRDLGPFTKLVWPLRAFPEAFIVTADDDAYYEPGWLESLTGAHDPRRPSILCRRAHRLRFGDGGTILPYAQWAWDVQDDAARLASIDLFPTGVGGVLYPPGSLHPEVDNEAAFRELCPTNDDVWFYWMGRLAGSTVRKVGPRSTGISWPGSQRVSLARRNVAERNDTYLRAMLARYGSPFVIGSRVDSVVEAEAV